MQANRPPKSGEKFRQIFLSKEFVLLAIGALISSFLIPNLLQISSDHQKELEVKTNLIKQIGESTMNPLALVQTLEGERRGDTSIELPNSTNKALTDERLKLLRTSAVIKSQLLSYFPGPEIPQKWKNITTATYSFVRLFSFNDEEFRRNLTQSVYRELGIPQKDETVETLSTRSNASKYSHAYFELQTHITNQQEDLIRMILSQGIPTYHNSIFEIFTWR